MNVDELIRRAYDAYFRTGRRAGSIDPVDEVVRALCEVRGRKGRVYVSLKNVRGIVAVYRVKSDGALRRLKRWPKELEA